MQPMNEDKDEPEPGAPVASFSGGGSDVGQALQGAGLNPAVDLTLVEIRSSDEAIDLRVADRRGLVAHVSAGATEEAVAVVSVTGTTGHAGPAATVGEADALRATTTSSEFGTTPVPAQAQRVAGVVERLGSTSSAADWMSVNVSVVIPALNEAKNLPFVLGRLPQGLHQVILVDGHSLDGTIDVARTIRSDVEVVLQGRHGKGNALAHGFAAVTGEVIVMLDADGSADPGEIPAFVTALVHGADFAKGSRFRPGGGSSDITAFRRAGNHVLNMLVNILFRTRYTDLCYGYNAFWSHLLPALDLQALTSTSVERVWGDGFEIETLINVRIAGAGARIDEVPSFEHPRLHGVSNLHTVRDGARVLRTIIRERVALSKRSRPLGAPTPAPLAAGGGLAQDQ